MNRRSRSPHGALGWLLTVLGVAIPGVMAVLAASIPPLGWIGPSDVSGPVVRVFVGVVGVLLCTAACGFSGCRAWAWWLIVAWGGYSLFEVTRSAFASPPVVTIFVPQLGAVLLVAYVWNRRLAFGVTFEASHKGAPV